MIWTSSNNNLKGIIYSVCFHLLLLVIGFLTYIHIPFPKEETESGGIIINYGTSDDGSGNNYTSMEEPSVGENITEKIIEDPNRPESPTEPITENSDEKVVTQDIEEAPEVKSKESPKKESKPVPTETKEPAPAQPVADSRALFKGKKNTGTGTGDGVTGKPGNQGKPNGSVISDSYNGTGNGNGGIALNLEGRRFMIKPSINDNGQLAGKIVVQISVNKDGDITDVRAGVKGTTITNSELWAKCEKAARAARLNPLSTAPDIQVGTVVFTFILR